MSEWLDLHATADYLNVSAATVRNWVKASLITPTKNARALTFSLKDVSELRKNIEQGKTARLAARANKSARSTTRVHRELDSNVNINNVSWVFGVLIGGGLSKREALIYMGAAVALKLARKDLISRIESQFEISLKAALLHRVMSAIPSGVSSHNLLSLAYQHAKSDGEKSRKGALYTPYETANDAVQCYVDSGAQKILDPCCGAGVYLVAAIRRLKSLGVVDWSSSIYGADNDELAVICATLNCLFEVSESQANRKINIFHADSLLLEESHPLSQLKFDLVLSNPPWGATISRQCLPPLKKRYPDVKTRESFSYFIAFAFDHVRAGGVVSYLLPESMLTTNHHQDVRAILWCQNVLGIVDYGRLFTGLLAEVVRIDVRNEPRISDEITISSGAKKFGVHLDFTGAGRGQALSISVDESSSITLKKIESKRNIYLKNSAKWGLGIVTGNNDLHLRKFRTDGFEPIIKGADVGSYVMKTPSMYTQFDAGKFQQCARESIYRASEKLIYKFVSRRLCVAIDRGQRITLNSANIIIPQTDKSIKFVLAALNARYANFYFQKKFRALKVLRSHLEQIPIPSLSDKETKYVESLVDEILDGQNAMENKLRIDAIFNTYYGISDNEL